MTAKQMLRRLLPVFLVPAVLQGAPADLAELGESVGLTVYNQDFAIVRERRNISLPAGRSELKFKDVAATIVPESVHFRSLAPADDAIVVEQNYEFDLLNADKLLHKYIDKPISVVTRSGDLLEGKLSSYDDKQLVIDGPGGIELIPRGKNIKDIRFSALPGGLLTKPTLVWLIEAQQAGEHLLQIAYRANNINWRVDYRVVANSAGDKVDLSGWVTVNNRSGMTYRDARLKLMAGDVHVVKKEDKRLRKSQRAFRVGLDMVAEAPAFEEKAFAEYHLYELPRPTTIKDRQTKQIELIDITQVPVKRKYQYRGRGGQVDVLLEFKNEKETHPGLEIPLPKGPIRVYQRDSDGQTEFISSDQIDHTPKKEPVKIKTGSTFDIKAARVQTGNRQPTRLINEQDWQIRIRNHKDQPIAVEIVEKLQHGNWQIIDKSHEFTKKDYRTIIFDVEVSANSETVVTYTVRYTR